jgi:hypothetical protein
MPDSNTAYDESPEERLALIRKEEEAFDWEQEASRYVDRYAEMGPPVWDADERRCLREIDTLRANLTRPSPHNDRADILYFHLEVKRRQAEIMAIDRARLVSGRTSPGSGRVAYEREKQNSAALLAAIVKKVPTTDPVPVSKPIEQRKTPQVEEKALRGLGPDLKDRLSRLVYYTHGEGSGGGDDWSLLVRWATDDLMAKRLPPPPETMSGEASMLAEKIKSRLDYAAKKMGLRVYGPKKVSLHDLATLGHRLQGEGLVRRYEADAGSGRPVIRR